MQLDVIFFKNIYGYLKCAGRGSGPRFTKIGSRDVFKEIQNAIAENFYVIFGAEKYANVG